MTTAVIGIAWNDVFGQYSHKKIAHNSGCLFRLVGNLKAHRTMNTKCTRGSHGIKQYRDITMSYQPFGMLPELLQGNPTQQVHGAVTPS